MGGEKTITSLIWTCKQKRIQKIIQHRTPDSRTIAREQEMVLLINTRNGNKRTCAGWFAKNKNMTRDLPAEKLESGIHGGSGSRKLPKLLWKEKSWFYGSNRDIPKALKSSTFWALFLSSGDYRWWKELKRTRWVVLSCVCVCVPVHSKLRSDSCQRATQKKGTPPPSHPTCLSCAHLPSLPQQISWGILGVLLFMQYN